MAEAVNSLFSIVSVGMLFGILSAWNLYRVAALRQDLFDVRDQLFDVAVRNRFLFKHPSYILLRARINNAIRFAHKFTTTRLMVTLLLRRGKASPLEEWREALPGLPTKLQEELLSVHGMMIIRLACHLIHMPIGLLRRILLLVSASAQNAADAAKKELVEKVEVLEAQAVEERDMEIAEHQLATAR